MASNYNSRPRAAEVMVHGDRWQVIRPREALAELPPTSDSWKTSERVFAAGPRRQKMRKSANYAYLLGRRIFNAL